MSLDAAACPHLEGFDPGLPEQAANPFPHLERARNEVPVFFLEKYGLWAITRYEDVREALRDTKTFSSSRMIRVPEVPDEYKDRLEYFPMAIQPAGIDPPAHTPLRKLAQKAFTQTAAKAREEDIRSIAHGLIDEFESAGRVDLVPRYCELVPMFTAAAMLGVTPEDIDVLRQWTRDSVDLMLEPLEHDRLLEVAERMVAFDRFIRDLIEERRSEPTDDVLSLLVHARGDDGEEALTEAELLGLVTTILTGGTDTTGGVIGRMFHELLRSRHLWEEVKADLSLAPNVVEETLRMYGTVQGIVRATTREVDVAGVTIPADASVWLHLGSADRDDVFESPNVFDIHRPKSEYAKHVALGRGTHFCLGAPFARLETRVALEVAAQRLPTMRVVDPDALDVFPSLFVAGIQHLEVEWNLPA